MTGRRLDAEDCLLTLARLAAEAGAAGGPEEALWTFTRALPPPSGSPRAGPAWLAGIDTTGLPVRRGEG